MCCFFALKHQEDSRKVDDNKVGFNSLSKCVRDDLSLVLGGLQSAEAANIRCCSKRTVDFNLSTAYGKFETVGVARSRNAVYFYLFKNDLIGPFLARAKELRDEAGRRERARQMVESACKPTESRKEATIAAA